MLFLSCVLYGVFAYAKLLAPSQCIVSEISASSLRNGSVAIDTSPSSRFEQSTLSGLNATAFEYWYFDGVSKDATSGVRVGFYRDPSFLSAGIKSPLWIAVDILSSTSKASSVILATDSRVESCDGGIARGTWTGDGMKCEFEFHGGIAKTVATVSVQGKAITGEVVYGNYSLKSFSTARYPDGKSYPNAKSSVKLAPLIYWNEGIPAGNVDTRMTINSSTVAFSGDGGFDRNWGPYGWEYIGDYWWWVRAVVGPYSLVVWRYSSPVDGKMYMYTYLEEAGAIVFKSNSNLDVSFELLYDGRVRGTFNDVSTGFAVAFANWRFKISHTNIIRETPKASNYQYTRFVNVVDGGELDADGYAGTAFSEQMKINKVLPL